jgi:hypothetical protein
LLLDAQEITRAGICLRESRKGSIKISSQRKYVATALPPRNALATRVTQNA